jgi:hypothetical protein
MVQISIISDLDHGINFETKEIDPYDQGLPLVNSE